MIGITGEMRGQVMIVLSYTKALEIASKMMMGMPVENLMKCLLVQSVNLVI